MYDFVVGHTRARVYSRAHARQIKTTATRSNALQQNVRFRSCTLVRKCAHAHMHVRMHALMHARMHSHTYTRARARVHTYVPYAHTHTQQGNCLQFVCYSKPRIASWYVPSVCGSSCNTLQHTGKHCNTLQHTATHHNTPQHTATHCNTPQHTARNMCL